MTHLLDRPVWSALSTRLAGFSLGGDAARRFIPAVGPLASARNDSAASLRELAALVPAHGNLLLLQAPPIVLPDELIATTEAAGVQLVAEALHDEWPLPPEAERLTARDAPEMLALAGLTKPGPFALRTHELGVFWGVKLDGRLVAMAGERMRQPGFTEVSGVCTHPDARGRGYARSLSRFVARRIFERGETPYLHAYANNAAAITLYESLGFRLRSHMNVAVVEHRGA